jgi:shikimate dehydrogenase
MFLLDEVFALSGFSVTIPYKETIIPYLDELDESAKKTGAVNSVHVKNGKLIGYNTDIYGFSASLEPLLQKPHQNALILGTGGASKAVAFALHLLKIKTTFVSRSPKDQVTLTYDNLDKKTVSKYQIIINTTPLGTFPNVSDCPDIPYQFLTNQHIAFDLVYNPEETLFLKKAKEQGCITQNGLAMLHLQAERSWGIWTTD